MATVHNLAENVSQVFPRNYRVIIQVVIGALPTAEQIASVEWVVHIPAYSCISRMAR